MLRFTVGMILFAAIFMGALWSLNRMEPKGIAAPTQGNSDE